MLDELGDVLFQVHFLSLLLEERGAGDLAAVAEHCSRKLVRRHPHVFGEVEASDAAAVLRNWDAIKRAEEHGPGHGTGVPANLPATIYARKAQGRLAAAGCADPDSEAALRTVREQSERLAATLGGGGAGGERGGEAASPGELRDERFEAVGELLYAAVAAARDAGVDAELALRATADRHRERFDLRSSGSARGEGSR